MRGKWQGLAKISWSVEKSPPPNQGSIQHSGRQLTLWSLWKGKAPIMFSLSFTQRISVTNLKKVHVFIPAELSIYLVLFLVIRSTQLGRIMHNQYSSSYQPAKQKSLLFVLCFLHSSQPSALYVSRTPGPLREVLVPVSFTQFAPSGLT